MNFKRKFILFFKKTWAIKILIVALIVITYTAILMISGPSVVNDKSSNLESFSAERAYHHIEQIAKKPHYHTPFEEDDVAYSNLKEVRKYIEDTLESLDVVTYKRNYPIGTNYISNYYDETGALVSFETTSNYDIVNYIVEFKGKNDTAILLSAHYDSAPPNYWPNIYDFGGQKKDTKGVSNGAADNGIGIGTILEIARLLKLKSQNGELENSVKLLINDGEEIGYYGVKFELTKHADYYKDVGFVINLEARGTKGNAIMFETVKNNSRVIELFNAGKNKYANSLSTFITDKLFGGAGYTDFGRYTENGFVGVGFANVRPFDSYHSAHDNLDNVSKKTLQQLGNQVYPMVLEFTGNSQYSDIDYFQSGDETVFFVIAPNLLISMNFIIQYIIVGLIIIGTIILLYIKIKKRMVSMTKSLLMIIPIFVMMVITFVVGASFTYLIGLISNVEFKFVNMYGINSFNYFLSCIVLIIIFSTLVWLLNIKITRKYKFEIAAATVIIFLLAALTTLILLPHATHLFSIMLLYSTWLLLKDFIKFERIKFIISTAVILLLSLFYLPNLTEIFHSLGFGGLSIVMVIGFIPAFMVAQLLNSYECNEENIIIFN